MIHLAAHVGGLYANMTSQSQFYHINSKINDNVLAVSAKSGIRKCVSCLSTCIFPNDVNLPFDETMVGSCGKMFM